MEGKFAHLLQPIRNLATNWDVNVAEELEDYLVSQVFAELTEILSFAAQVLLLLLT